MRARLLDLDHVSLSCGNVHVFTFSHLQKAQISPKCNNDENLEANQRLGQPMECTPRVSQNMQMEIQDQAHRGGCIISCIQLGYRLYLHPYFRVSS